jgi:hypothetical protein
MKEVHDFEGPYQIHNTHDGHTLVFVKGIYEAFDFQSDRLTNIIEGKISALNTELLKWNALKTSRMEDND